MSGRRSEPPLELADEQYQAPFSREFAEVQNDTGLQTPPSPSSSFFDADELREARDWVRNSQSDDESIDAGGRVGMRRRRDSQVGSYDDHGSIFDGPGAELIPSSVSSMHHVVSRPSFRTYSRRRQLLATHRSRSYSHRSSSLHDRETSPHSSQTHGSGSRMDSAISYRKRSFSRSVPRAGADGESSGLIGSLFASFRGESGGLSGRDEDYHEAADEPWGQDESDLLDEEVLEDASEDEELDHSDRSSVSSERPTSPTSRFIPNVFGNDADPFGDVRHDNYDDASEVPFEDPALSAKPTLLRDYPDVSELLDEPRVLQPGAEEEGSQKSVWLDKSCRSRQQIYLLDEDTLIRITGYCTRRDRVVLYVLLCVLTLGIAGLMSMWFPKWHLRWMYAESQFSDAEFVVVENQWGDVSEERFLTVPFARPLRTVFPPSSRDPPCTHAEAQAIQHETDEGDEGDMGDAIFDLVMFDYRYTRFVLHPPSGRFRTIREWRDVRWDSTANMGAGIKSDLARERAVVFGPNMIEIASSSTWQLLVGEVLHPFYIFQIVSIILWSLDDYYYYACCIAAISIGSIASTLVETKRTIARMREMNRFVCTVRVWRDNAWVELNSSELVPGDVYDAADPQLQVLPADSLLLSGDAIVNESMLTGESVPVSKLPITDAGLSVLASARVDDTLQLARHFLFAGTKVIRIRPAFNGTEEPCAKAMVLRTGFNTTKGSLVRGMLFPKPMGFKFYVRTERRITDAARLFSIHWLPGLYCRYWPVLQHGQFCAARHHLEHVDYPRVGPGHSGCSTGTACNDEHWYSVCHCASSNQGCVLYFAHTCQYRW